VSKEVVQVPRQELCARTRGLTFAEVVQFPVPIKQIVERRVPVPVERSCIAEFSGFFCTRSWAAA
jgi:hypothetical protein